MCKCKFANCRHERKTIEDFAQLIALVVLRNGGLAPVTQRDITDVIKAKLNGRVQELLEVQ